MPDQPRYLSQHDPFAQSLMAALGLPRRTLSFELRFEVGSVPTCRVMFHPDTPAGLDPTPMLREYMLVRLDAAEQLERHPTAVAVPPAGPDEAADLDDAEAGLVLVAGVDPERSTLAEAEEARRAALAAVEAHDRKAGGALLGIGRPVIQQPQSLHGDLDDAAGQRGREALMIGTLAALALLVVLSFVLGWWG